MTIPELVSSCHEKAKEKGFWDNQENTFNIAEKLMLITSELGEACEAARSNTYQGRDNEWVKDTFEDELADVVIRIADLCGRMNIDLEWQLRNKINYNTQRPYKHGKLF